MVDKCLQSPPPFSIPTQHLDISIGPQSILGQTIEDQLNSKGEPPEQSLHLSTIKRTLPNAHQVMSPHGEYIYGGGERGLEQMAEEAALKGTENDDKLSEEEVQSMASGKSKSTANCTAEDWFNHLNQNVRGYNNFAGYDDDPPYYLPNDALQRKHQLGFKQSRPHKLSRIHPPGETLRGRRVGGEGTTVQSSQSIVNGLALPTEMMGTGIGGVVESTSDSNSECYRSVIDDLTIKNQKLKRRLRKLEELQAEHLQTDKVFELRIHGLSQSKRQELENLLQQFSSTLHNSPDSGPALAQSPPTTSTGSSFGPSTVVTSDSAYASNLGSGTGSLAGASTHQSLASGKSGDSRHSKGSWNATGSGRGTVPSGNSGGVNGKKVPTYISEKAKMKQVVRRLEYLFSGKRSQDQHLAPNRHQSKTVSSDFDDVVGNLEGQEGVKEKPATGLDDSPVKSPEPDSRLPQIPEQNLEYLHNLTSTSPTHEPLNIGGHWDGWVYLNLVINLAQLHTINVTVPFVKKAIASMSVKLELSPDGKMVRWKGEMEGSNLANEIDTKSESNSPPSRSSMDASSESFRGRKRSDGSHSQPDLSLIARMPVDIKMAHSMETSLTRLSTLSRSHGSGPRSSPSSQHSSGFHYKPLFAQSKNFEDDSSEPSETGYSSSSGVKSSSTPDGASGGYSGAGSRTRGRKPTVGPIIYYENGKFCTDLSAQHVNPRDESTTPEYPYERMTNEVVGAPGSENTDTIDQNSRPLLRTLAPLETLVEGQLLGGRAGGSTDEDEDDDSYATLEFSPKLESTLPDDPPLPVELEASGIGGVQPEDNFAINVQVKHYLLPKGRNAQTLNSRKLKSKLRGISHRIPQSSIDVFLRDEAGMGALPATRPRSRSSSSSPSPPHSSSSDGRDLLTHELVSARFIKLPPSSLPPASYFYFSPSSEESRSDSDCGLNSSSQSDSYPESQLNDVLTDDGRDIQTNKHTHGSRTTTNRRAAAEYMGEGSSTVSSSRMSEGGTYRKLVVRMAPFPPDSSAATAGSGCESMEEDNEEEDISENDVAEYYQRNDSDEIMRDFGLDNESLDGAEGPNRLNLKRTMNSKDSVDSIPLSPTVETEEELVEDD
ncbi:frequency clock protein-domain-containing protein [Terfezia claveryi]|nr:frequency clock protein-domain-containing protein [Terfezia claveryi]